MAGAETPIAVEPDINIENYGQEADSAYDSEVASYTTSLASGVTNYKFEHGRRYHAYKEGSYIFPNDEKENDRLDIMHKLTETILKGKLFLAPSKNPRRILDIGTGTGIWAMEMGDMFPTADILGNDLSPIQPRWVPPNVRFEVDDVEADWTYSQKFDFVHCRNMTPAIRDWPRLVQQAYEFTIPGGYAEFIDMDLTWRSPDGSLKEDSVCKKANTEFLAATRAVSIEPNPGPKLEGWLKDAGYLDVHAEKYVMPFGTWPADRHLKEVGAWNYLQFMEGVESFMTALLTRRLGYTIEEVQVLCARIKAEMKDPKLHAMCYM
ncbi:hypothetical protein MMC06_000526 [Schaereria dolodes]|nr:hypothetical protein [Schaereria dolodes]